MYDELEPGDEVHECVHCHKPIERGPTYECPNCLGVCCSRNCLVDHERLCEEEK